jgi:hypothetical protein
VLHWEVVKNALKNDDKILLSVGVIGPVACGFLTFCMDKTFSIQSEVGIYFSPKQFLFSLQQPRVVKCCIRECIQKFLDWPLGAKTVNGTALYHYVQLYRYFMSHSSDFYHHNPLCCFSTSVYCCKRVSHPLSPETFGYTLLCGCNHIKLSGKSCLLCVRYPLR